VNRGIDDDQVGDECVFSGYGRHGERCGGDERKRFHRVHSSAFNAVSIQPGRGLVTNTLAPVAEL
jgi:hypothetical protein